MNQSFVPESCHFHVAVSNNAMMNMALVISKCKTASLPSNNMVTFDYQPDCHHGNIRLLGRLSSWRLFEYLANSTLWRTILIDVTVCACVESNRLGNKILQTISLY